MLWEFFVFGSIAFWILTALFVFFVCLAVDDDSPVGAIVLMVLYLAFIWFLGDFKWSTLIEYKNQILIGCIIYVLVGLGWSVFKWVRLVLSHKKLYLAKKEKFMKMHRLEGKTIPEDLRIEFRKHLGISDYDRGDVLYHFAPSPKHNKEKIISWMAYWPFSALTFCLKDLVSEVFNAVYTACSGLYRTITNQIYSDVKKDIGE